MVAVICILVIGVVAVGVYIYNNQKSTTYTFAEISDSRSQKIYSANDNSKEDMIYIVDMYNDGYFKKYAGETGNTATRDIFFYDEKGSELFKMTELGNKNLVKISLDGKESIFQFFRKK